MTRLFDPSAMMNENIAANATKRDPLPVGETDAQVTKVEFKQGEYTDKNTREKKTWTRLDATMEITDPEYLAQVGDGTQTKAIVFHGIMLDIGPDGAVATGPNKNVALGKFRDAANVNGQPLNMLQGQWVRIGIGHKQNPKDESETLHEVTSVTRKA